jgi:hypothetical protein
MKEGENKTYYVSYRIVEPYDDDWGGDVPTQMQYTFSAKSDLEARAQLMKRWEKQPTFFLPLILYRVMDNGIKQTIFFPPLQEWISNNQKTLAAPKF